MGVLPLAKAILFCLNSVMLDEIRAEILRRAVPEDLLNAFEEEVRCLVRTELPPGVEKARKDCSIWRLKYLKEEQRALKAEMLLAVVKSDKAALEEPARSVVEARVARAPSSGIERRVAQLGKQCSEYRVKYLQEQQRAEKAVRLIAVKEEKIEQLKKTVGKLSAYIKWMRQQIFGSTSERTAQKEQVQSGEGTPGPQSNESSKEKKPGKRPGAKGSGRDRDKVTPRPVSHDLEEKDKVCKCGCELVLTDLAPLLSYETHFVEEVVVRQHIRRKVMAKCIGCGRKSIRKAPVPPKLVPKGKYSPEFWQTIIGEKFWLQRPLNRLIKKLKSLGANVRAGTITNGLKRFYDARIFEVIYEAILDRSRLAEVRKMDETGWKVFADEEKKNWYLWTSVTTDTTVFILDPSRSSTVVDEFLKGITTGIILADRHSAYKKFCRLNEGFLIAFCWVHQRRDMIKLQTAYPEHKVWAQGWQDKIDALLAQNKVRVKTLGTAEFKAQDDILRKMVEQFRTELDSQLKNKSLAKEQRDELKSLDTHWSGLTVFVDNPHVPMDNNEAERALREAVLGRKNYYGSRSLWSAHQTSWLFTIYATLEQHGIDPHKWMTEYLNACAHNGGLPPVDKKLAKFLPWNYKGMNEQTTKSTNADSTVKPATEPDVEQAVHSVSFFPLTDHVEADSTSTNAVSNPSNSEEAPSEMIYSTCANRSETNCKKPTSTSPRKEPKQRTKSEESAKKNTARNSIQNSTKKTSRRTPAHLRPAKKPP